MGGTRPGACVGVDACDVRRAADGAATWHGWPGSASRGLLSCSVWRKDASSPRGDLDILIAPKKTGRIRGLLNRVVSSRVDAQLDWRTEVLEERMRGLEEPIATLQRLITEMSASVGSRLTALEAAALEDRKQSS